MNQKKSNKDNIVEINSQETRIALLEQSISYMRQSIDEIKFTLNRLEGKVDSNFRWLLTAIAGLAGIMAHGFHWI
jgi:hypothetical protein